MPFIDEHLSADELVDYKELRWRIDHADTPLMALRALSDLLALAHKAERIAVREARLRGESWAKIAEAMKRSRQSVHRQYTSGTNGIE